jgi:hypothetical protein
MIMEFFKVAKKTESKNIKIAVSLHLKESRINSPTVRYAEQKMTVSMMNQRFHSWVLLMVATPRNMKMMVSEELLNIFMAYLIVV